MSIKAAFVTGFGLTTHLATAIAVWQLALGGPWLPWVGVLLTALPFALLLDYWMLTASVSRTSEGLPGLTGSALLGVLLAALPWLGVGEAAPPALGLALGGATGVFLYVHWYSVFGRTPSEALRVGQPLPSFTLEDAAGKTLRSEDFRGTPTVLIFHRGNWCPLCMAQIKEIAGLYRELDARGAKVKLVSPQSHDKTKNLAKRFDAPFDFLVDPGNRTARQLGIASDDGIPAGMQVLGYDTETVMPTVIITDAEGVILFCDETDNYRVRPEPETFLKVLDEHTG